MATGSYIPDEPDHFDDFGSTVMYLCEEAERLGLVRTRAVLLHAYAQLPSEIATLREGLGQHRESQQLEMLPLQPEFLIFHSWLMVLFALYSSAHTGKYRCRAVARFFDSEVRQLFSITTQTPLPSADLDGLVEITRAMAQRLAEQQTGTGARPVSQDESVRKQIDSLVPISYGSD